MRYNPTFLGGSRLFCGSYACNDTHSPDGRVLIVPMFSSDGKALLSCDRGESWESIPTPKAVSGARFIRLADGTYISLGFDNAVFEAVANRGQKNFPFVLSVYRADSFDGILSGNVKSSFVNVEIPELCAGFGDSGNAFAGCVSNCITQLSNGDIFATMYGQFSSDTTLCPYFKEYGNYSFYLYRSWCIVSHDGGKSFEYLSTIADVQTYPIADINAEGYCEPDCIEAEPGHLVCLLRTGGHEVYSPMYCAHSYDFGKSWSEPVAICDWGVLPRLLKMHDGTLVCASGHTHTILLFSDDCGLTWSEPFIVEECDGKWDKSPSGYNTVCEYRPGELSVVYDDPKEGMAENAPDGQKRNIYEKRFRIDRK